MATRKITVTPVVVRGKTRYRVNYFSEGARRRQLCKSKTAAEAEAARLRSEQDKTGKVWNQLPADERSRLMDAWHHAKRKGVDLHKVIHSETSRPVTTEKSLDKTRIELLEAKKNSGKDVEYRKTLDVVLKQFCRGRESLPIHLVTLSDVETFLDSKALASRSTNRARLSTLFNYAVRRGYRADNPCNRLETVTYHKPSPKILSPMQTGRCLVWLRKNPRVMAWFVLTTFYGLRPEEAQKTDKKKINLKTGEVTIDTQTTKVRQRRVVECPHPKALQLLKASIEDFKSELPISKQLRRRTAKRLRKLLGFSKWPKDITRHTAASNWLAIKPDASYVAEQLGNSVKVLKRDYKALRTVEQARRFYGEHPPLN